MCLDLFSQHCTNQTFEFTQDSQLLRRGIVLPFSAIMKKQNAASIISMLMLHPEQYYDLCRKLRKQKRKNSQQLSHFRSLR